MGSIAALVLFLATAYALPTLQQPAAETADHVVSITLQSIHSGWGRKQYVGTIERSGTGFVLGGEVVANSKVSTLLDAFRSRRDRVPKEQIADLASYVVDSCASALTAEFGSRMQDKAFGSAAITACKGGANNFVSGYLSPSNLDFHTDDYPEEALVVTFDDGHTVSALSRSQNTFMLPWRVVGRSFQGLVYDTAIPKSVAALFGNHDINADRLSVSSLPAEYAEHLNLEPPKSLPSPSPVVHNQALERAMTSANVSAKWSELNDITGRITGEIGSSRWARITVNFDCPAPNDATSATRCLANPVNKAGKLATLSWIRAISLRPSLRVRIRDGDFASMDLSTLSKIGDARPDIAALLPAVRASGIFFNIEPAQLGIVDGSSTWVLLPNERSVLIAYNPGRLMSAAGLDEARIGGTGWYRKVAALFSRDGVLIGPVANPPPRERLSDVSSITIRSRGNGGTTQKVIEASAFQAKTYPLRAAAVSRLLDAIYSGSSSPLASTSQAETSELLRACDRITSQQLGAYTSSSSTSAPFEERCRNTNNLASFLESYNDSPDGLMLDDGFHGSVLVSITYKSGATLKLTSDSHLAFMIPWNVTSTGVPRTSYDPNIGAALASITDRSDPNLPRLNGSILAQQYGNDIRKNLYQYASHRAELPSAELLVPALRYYAETQGYRLENMAYDRGENSIVGMLSSPQWNSNVWVQFRCPVKAAPGDLPPALAPSIALGARIAQVPWIQRALTRPELRVMAYPWRSLQSYEYTNDSVVQDFENWSNVGSGLSSADIRRLSESPGVAWFVLKEPQPIELSLVAADFTSDWMLLPNDTAVLGLYTLGLPEYIGLTRDMPSFSDGIMRYAAALIGPTGSVQSQP
jgi:hypothetical protein